MKLKWTHGAALLACIALSGCGMIGGDKAPKGQVVATVNGEEITVTELNRELAGAAPAHPAERKAAEQAEAAKQALREVHAVKVPVVTAPKVTGSASKTFTVWDYEITDPALVPLAYRPIDTAAIARDVKAGKDECKIPGVRVFSRIEVK